MSQSVIPSLASADMPERKLAFWKMTGPGAVLVGLSIGAGELIIWPRIAAEFGSSMLWAAAVGVFLQFWINIEIGRWTIATGETPYLSYARMWRGFAFIFIAFNFFGWFFPGWARASGAALKALCVGPGHSSPNWLWTAITFAAVAATLFGPKKVYATVEKTVTSLVVLITAGLLIIAFKLGTWAHVQDMVKGILNVGYREPGMSFKALFIAMVFAGAGGTANLFYSFYLRDKQIGMGGRIPLLINPFRQRVETTIQPGYRYPETPENARRFRDWMRYVILDQTLYFWLLNTFTMFLFIFGALVVLHPAGIVPQSDTLIWDEAYILGQSMGAFGRNLFLLIGVATLFSTQITLVDGVARSMADICHGAFAGGRKIAESKWYAGWAIGMIAFGILVTMLMEIGNYKQGRVLDFLFNAAYFGGFAMAVYTPLQLYLNLRHLPPSARPGWLNILMTSIAAIIYVGFAVFCLVDEVKAMF